MQECLGIEQKTSKQYKIYVWSVAIICSQFIGLYNIVSPITQIYYTEMISVLLILISLLAIIFFLHGKIRIGIKNKTDLIFLALVILCFAEIVHTSIIYHGMQTLTTTIKEALHYLSAFLVYVVLLNLTNGKADILYFIRVIIKISFLCSLMALIAFVLLELGDINILRLNTDSYSFYSRGSARFNIGMMIYIPGMMFSLVNMIKKCGSKLDTLTILLGFLHVIIISKTRSLFVWILLALILYTYIGKLNRKKIIGLFFFAFIISYGVVYLPSIINGIQILAEDASFAYRLGAIEFYLGQLKDHPLLGMGLIGATNNALGDLLYGPLNRFYRVDVGIVGFVNGFGIIGLYWLLSYILNAFKTLRQHKECESYLFREYSLLLFVFLVLASSNLLFMNSGLIFEMIILTYLIRYV